ncbi:MAG: hypothetical protein RIA62_07620 [Cyclobacteriaceae bacterium]
MRVTLLIPLAICFSCYNAPQIAGFDEQAWQQSISCDQDRLNQAAILLKNEERLLASNQNEIQELLGSPNEHELYSRNQKFFYYDLRPKCDTIPGQRLSIRFDALGRVNDIQIIKVFD